MITHTVTIAIVDDHVLFREGLKDLLSDQSGFKVVAEGGSGFDALTIVADNKPDVLIADLRLPQMGGIAAIRRIRTFNKAVKIVVVSMYEDDEHKRDAIMAGADAYLSKMDDSKKVIQAILDLVSGKVLVSADQMRKYQASYIESPQLQESISHITDFEFRVLEELCHGKNNKEIADSVMVSERTVKNHLNEIFRKLGAKSRLDAVRIAIQKKLVQLTMLCLLAVFTGCQKDTSDQPQAVGLRGSTKVSKTLTGVQQQKLERTVLDTPPLAHSPVNGRGPLPDTIDDVKAINNLNQRQSQ